MDNTQFRMGRVLVGEGGGHDASVSLVHRLGRAAKGLYVTWWKGIDPAQACAATFVFEGRKEEVQSQRAAVARLVASSTDGGRAFMTGAAAGKAGYELTLGIAYLRDFGLSHRVLGESLEAFVPWSQVEAALDSVREAARAAHAALGLEGQPMVTSRVTQLYDEGVCLYVYVAIHCRALGSRGDGGVGPYKQVEGAVRSALLGCGASLSHHHGVGKCAKAGLLRERAGPGMRGVMAAVKEALDPHNVFGARNGLLLPPSGLEKEQACVKNKEQEQGESRM
jgi:alkyldihydroxyacetonephosphate synthase